MWPEVCQWNVAQTGLSHNLFYSHGLLICEERTSEPGLNPVLLKDLSEELL